MTEEVVLDRGKVSHILRLRAITRNDSEGIGLDDITIGDYNL